jgi:hypothetical protein
MIAFVPLARLQTKDDIYRLAARRGMIGHRRLETARKRSVLKDTAYMAVTL